MLGQGRAYVLNLRHTRINGEAWEMALKGWVTAIYGNCSGNIYRLVRHAMLPPVVEWGRKNASILGHLISQDARQSIFPLYLEPRVRGLEKRCGGD